MTPDRWQKGLAALDRAAPEPSPAAEPAPERAVRVDDWYNVLTGIGGATYDKRQGSAFAADVVDDVSAAELWRGDDLAARVVETLPNEMLRQGYEIRIAEEFKARDRLPGEEAEPESPDETFSEAAARGDAQGWIKRRRARMDAEAEAKDLAEQIKAKLEDLGFDAALHTALCYERAYGGAAILLGVKDSTADLKQPLNPERVRDIEWLTVLEPRECQPIAWYNNPRAAKFGEPALYQVNPVSPGGTVGATMQVHESRMILFGGIRVSRRTVGGTLSGWGDSVLTRVYRVLRDYNMSWSATSILLTDYAQAVIKIKGLAETFQGNNAQALRDRMQAVELSRSVARTVIIDAEEEYERKTTAVTGLEALLDRFNGRLAAAADMPLTLLMGQSPGGLNATGESDVRFFYDRARALQDRKLRPVIERVVKMLFKVLEAEEPDSWSVYFCPLWQASDKEQAEARKLQAETDAIYITNQVLSPEEVARSRFATDEFSFATVVDFDGREASEPAAPPPAKSSQQLEQEAHERDLAVKTLEAKTGALREPTE